MTALWSSLLKKYPIDGRLTEAHGVMQNVPMGILNLNYLIRSMLEVMILRLETSTYWRPDHLSAVQCVEAAAPNQDKRVCDLQPGAQTIILLLSCITVSFATAASLAVGTSCCSTDGCLLAVLGDVHLKGHKARKPQGGMAAPSRAEGRGRKSDFRVAVRANCHPGGARQT